MMKTDGRPLFRSSSPWSLLFVLATLSVGSNHPCNSFGSRGIVLALAAATAAEKTSSSLGDEAGGVEGSSSHPIRPSDRRRLPLQASQALPLAARSSASAAYLQQAEQQQQPRHQHLRRRLGKDKETQPEEEEPSAEPTPAAASPPPTFSPVPAGGGVPPSPPPTSALSGGEGDGNSPSTPTQAPNPPAPSAPSRAAVNLLDFVVTYDASSLSESQVLASLNETLFVGFSAAYNNTKKIVLSPEDSSVQQQSSVTGDGERRVLQQEATRSLAVSGKVIFFVGNAAAPSKAEVQALQTSLLEKWQEGDRETSVTFPEAEGGNKSTNQSASSRSDAGLIAGLVVAAVVTMAIGAIVLRRSFRRRSQSPPPRGAMQVEILSEINDDYDDDIEGVSEKRSTEHADCDIEIEQLDESKGGVVMVTTSPTSTDTGSTYAQFSPSSAANGKNPDSVYLASLGGDEVDSVVSNDGGASCSVAVSLTDTESKKRQSKVLSSLRTFFSRQSKTDDTASVESPVLFDPKPVQMHEPEEKKDDDEVEVTIQHTLPASLTPPKALAPNAAALTMSPSLDSMEDYSLASASMATASFGPHPVDSPRHPANKWLSALRARVPSVESYHSDSESMFTYGEVEASSEVALAARALFVSHQGETSLLGAVKETGDRHDVDDRSTDEIMSAPRSWRLTPKRTHVSSNTQQKTSPTSCLSPIGSPMHSKTSPTSESRGGRDDGDEDEPFDETLEDDQDLEIFAAELERVKARLYPVHPDLSPPRDVSKSSLRNTPIESNVGGGSACKDKGAPPASTSASLKSSSTGSSGAHEETLAEFLRHKRGETRNARNESRREQQTRMTTM